MVKVQIIINSSGYIVDLRSFVINFLVQGDQERVYFKRIACNLNIVLYREIASSYFQRKDSSPIICLHYGEEYERASLTISERRTPDFLKII